MPESPPKRVTRAKATKAVNEVAEGPKTTRITTASARIAAEARAATALKSTTKPTRTTKRKAKPENDVEDAIMVDNYVQQEAPKPRGRPRKTADKTSESATISTKTKTRQVKAKASEEQASIEQSKPKTRTRKAKTEDQQKEVEMEESQPTVTKRTTRARAGTVGSEVQAPAVSKTAVTKKATKKVTFQEDVSQDKENVPYSRETTKKEPVKATGIKAKPIRRPVSTRTTTRGKKVAGTKEEKKPAVQPLSPKKVTQVAKSSSNSSEDELSKSPLKSAMKSPAKPRVEFQQPRTPEKSPLQRMEYTPTRLASQSLITSPAKRPPPSPFKDSLKESPKKFSIVDGLSNLGPIPSMGVPEFKGSLKQSPKRFDFTPGRSQDQSRPTVGALARAALLGSPARRPTSPLKIGSVRAPGKTGTSVFAPNTTSAVRHFKSTSLFSATPRRLFSNHQKIMNAGDSSVKASGVTPSEPEELEKLEESEESEEPEEDPLSSGVSEPVAGRSPKGFVKYSEANVVQFGEPNPVFERDVFADSPDAPKFRSLDAESDSEDELLSGIPTMMSSRKSNSLLSEGLTPAPKSRATPRPRAKDLSMTPLAMQFSNWLAASPAKSDIDEGNSATDTTDVYTPVAEVLKKRSGENSRRTTITPINPGFFDEQLLIENNTSPSLETLQEQDLHVLEDVEIADMAETDQSQESEQYGDENIIPQITPDVQGVDKVPEARDEELTVTPARVFDNRPKEVHTVSRVPLKPASSDTPTRLHIKKPRSKSLAGPLVELDLSEDPFMSRALLQRGTAMIQLDQITENEPLAITPRSISQPLKVPQTPVNDLCSMAGTPFKLIREGADAQILRGAVVHVDVHTSEGADASRIFVDLLTQMGARCIKNWSWNPRASLAAGEDPTASGKVGITHVVFKDGSKRTLQKAREAKGIVLCVGVGWVLE